MTQSNTSIPIAIFQAQNLVQNARFYDHQDKYPQAVKYYLQATKSFTGLLKKYPNMPFHKQYAHEVRLCLDRINQLKPHVMNSTQSSKNPPVSRTKSKDDHQYAELRERILRCRITPDPNLSWDDIIGLEEVVHHIRETVLLPLQHPEILQSSIKPARSILLFGPPGCGKTRIIQVLATEIAPITIFHVSAGTILSKWHGESQKNIRVLYETAWEFAPSIIFIDEFDGIFGTTNNSQRHNGDSEASRITIQIQKELQQFMDGLYTPATNKTVTIVATNFPWHLQGPQLRRFDRILYVHPPQPTAIVKLLNHYLRKVPHDLDGNLTESISFLAHHHFNGYTPDEIQKICSAAYYRAINTSITNNRSPEVTCKDLLSCKSLLKPILRFKGVKGVSTLLFREWNEEWGRPPIDYPLLDWEKRGADPFTLLTLKYQAEKRS